MTRDTSHVQPNRLKIIRMSSGLSQQQLADKVDMKQSMINRIETQNANLTIQNAIKLSEFFNEPLENFWVDTYNKAIETEPRFNFLKMLKTWQLIEMQESIQIELMRRYREEDRIEDEE